MSETLSRERIIEIVGKLGAERIVEIIDTGASERELVEAKMLALQQEMPSTEIPGVRVDVVHRLYDILRADLIDPNER
jgi:hypothetical protein